MAIIKTAANRDEWLNNRRSGIGGSDIAAILGCSKYSTPFQVWLSKTAQADESFQSQEMRIGQLMEPVIAKLWEEQAETEATPNGTDTHWDECAPIFCTPDYFFMALNKVLPYERAPLSIKSSRLKIDQIPEHWFCQLQWEMGITGAWYGEIAWLEFGYDFHVKAFEFDADFFSYMKSYACEWWNNYVLGDDQPPPIIASDAERMYRKAIAGKVIEARPETIELVDRFARIKETRLRAEKEENKLAGEIKLLMRDAEAITVRGEPILTWRGDKNRTIKICK